MLKQPLFSIFSSVLLFWYINGLLSNDSKQWIAVFSAFLVVPVCRSMRCLEKSKSTRMDHHPLFQVGWVWSSDVNSNLWILWPPMAKIQNGESAYTCLRKRLPSTREVEGMGFKNSNKLYFISFDFKVPNVDCFFGTWTMMVIFGAVPGQNPCGLDPESQGHWAGRGLRNGCSNFHGGCCMVL